MLIPKALVSILLILMGQLVLAQSDNQIDSLIQVLTTARADTGKVTLLNKLGKICLDQSKYPESKKYLSEALSLSEKINFKEGEATTYNTLGILFRNEGNYDEAFIHQNNSLCISQEIGNKSGIARAYSSLGRIYGRIGNQEQSIITYHEALKIASEINDKKMMVQIHNGLGLGYDYLGNYGKAMKHYLASLKLAEEIGDKYGVGAANVNIGCVHSYLGNNEATLDHNLKALSIWKEIDHKSNMADAYTNIGEAYANLCDAEEATRYTLLGVNLAKEIDYKPALGAGLTKLGIIHTMNGNYQEAVKSYLESLYVWEQEGNRAKIAATLIFIGSGYENLKNTPEAIKYYKKGLDIATEIGSKIDMADACRFLSDSYTSIGNFKEALVYTKLQMSINDSLWNLTNMQQLADVKEKYESDKKDQEIDLLSKEKIIHGLNLKKQTQTKNYFIVAMCLLFILSFFIYRYYHTRQELKLLTLRNKIASDLHDDVGSTLSSISIFSQMAKAQSKEVIPALDTIGESSRKMLDAMADIVWTIKPENDQFDKVIMRMRGFAFELLGAKQIDFEFDADDDVANINLPMDARKNLYLIFKEATNNMVKYSEASRAKFALKGEKDKLMMVISDNGKGFDTTKEYHGNGLSNMRKRAIDIGGQLLINSASGGGTTISLELSV